MTPNAIDALDRAVPEVRQERHLPDNWSGDHAVIADTDDLAGEIEDDLFGDPDGDEARPTSLLPTPRANRLICRASRRKSRTPRLPIIASTRTCPF